MKIIRAQGGTAEKIVDLNAAQYPGIVPDLWHVGNNECLQPEVRAMILDCWHLAHDMFGALQCIENGADTTEPVPTKLRYMDENADLKQTEYSDKMIMVDVYVETDGATKTQTSVVPIIHWQECADGIVGKLMIRGQMKNGDITEVKDMKKNIVHNGMVVVTGIYRRTPEGHWSGFEANWA